MLYYFHQKVVGDKVDKTAAERIMKMLPILNEKQKRMYLAAEAESLGYGGVKAVHELTKVSQTTIIQGKKELKNPTTVEGEKIRKQGGGRKLAKEKLETLEDEIRRLVSNDTFGNPENPLLWTTKSLRNLEGALNEKGLKVSHDTIGSILKELGYSLQLNQKMLQVGKPHPDRNAQFEFINKKCLTFMTEGEPVISIDTKKKEMIGNFKNNGSEYSEAKTPQQVLDHDFPIKELGKVAPYGVYDISRNEGFINLGTSCDTSEFAAQSILRWWQILGQNTYPDATKIYINCDGGGSNGSRTKLWKTQLQELANITGLEIHVSHLPPRTSKWNKIEHKMFCYISKNWRGRPLISIETVINLIANTTTKQGLEIVCVLDENTYERGIKVTKEELDLVNINRDEFHGEWNYFISPQE